VTQERDWETAINAAEKLGGLHGLVNNTGIYQPRTLMGPTPSSSSVTCGSINSAVFSE
jgi:hypothetical protein